MDSDITRLDAVFPAIRSAIFQAVLRMVRDAAVAEELTQEAYLRARRALDTTEPRHMEAFLWQVARNLALDHIRWRKVRAGTQALDADNADGHEIADETPSAEENAIHRDHLRLVSAELLKLPPRAQKVWVLSRVEGWPYPRIAAHLGVSPNTVFNDIKMVMALLHELRARMDAP